MPFNHWKHGTGSHRRIVKLVLRSGASFTVGDDHVTAIVADASHGHTWYTVMRGFEAFYNAYQDDVERVVWRG